MRVQMIILQSASKADFIFVLFDSLSQGEQTVLNSLLKCYLFYVSLPLKILLSDGRRVCST